MNKSLYADIILPLALNAYYTYIIPEDLIQKVEVGSRVVVQFGRRKHYTGIISRIHEQKPEYPGVKPIISIPDKVPCINSFQLKLWEWMSKYYMCTMGEVMSAALP